MKNLILILFSMFVLSITSCTPNDAVQDRAHVGEWNLIHTSGGIIGADDPIPEGEVTWDFSSGGELVIMNTYEGLAIYRGPETGTYNYSIRFNSAGEYLIVDGGEMGQIIVDGDQLTINSSSLSTGAASDGIFYEFVK